MKIIIALLFVICVTPLFADVIYLTNGFSIQGEIMSVSGDTTIIKTKGPDSKEVKIATNQILRTEKEQTTEKSSGMSIQRVGFGCLGGLVGGLAVGTLAILTDGFGDTKVTISAISLAMIAGILIGINLGGK